MGMGRLGERGRRRREARAAARREAVAGQPRLIFPRSRLVEPAEAADAAVRGAVGPFVFDEERGSVHPVLPEDERDLGRWVLVASGAQQPTIAGRYVEDGEVVEGEFLRGTMAILLTDAAVHGAANRGEMVGVGEFDSTHQFVFSWPLRNVDWVAVSRTMFAFGGSEGARGGAWLGAPDQATHPAVADRRGPRPDTGRHPAAHLGQAVLRAACTVQSDGDDRERAGRAREILADTALFAGPPRRAPRVIRIIEHGHVAPPF